MEYDSILIEPVLTEKSNTMREEGRYVDSLREGPWTFVDPDGAKHTAVYERNVLVSR